MFMFIINRRGRGGSQSHQDFINECQMLCREYAEMLRIYLACGGLCET
jgi:hypothetical protein